MVAMSAKTGFGVVETVDLAKELMEESRKRVSTGALNRVIAKGLSPADTLVSEVMTSNPDCVSPDLTLLDALREMHDQKYLHLPVRDETTGVLGLVDVMELVCHTAGGEGGKGWRDFFRSAFRVGTDLPKRTDCQQASPDIAGRDGLLQGRHGGRAEHGQAVRGIDLLTHVVAQELLG